MVRYGTLILIIVLSAVAKAADVADIEFFEKKIRPLLAENCYSCHSKDAKKLKGKLRLDSREAMLKGGETGPSLVAGDPEKSLLVEAIRYKNTDLQMPPKTKLGDQQIADLTRWVQLGAPWPATTPEKESAPAAETFNIERLKTLHWAWKPVQPLPPPAVKDTAWPKSPIDQFILSKLEEANLQPAAPADRRALLRRTHFTITGLPPTPEQVDAFLQDTSPGAFAKVVDELLASSQFGERWGRHWLDLVRYAESRGHEFDLQTPNAYQYRDYVIRALNADVPYDQFVREQLAGDLLPNPRMHPTEKFNESIIGTAYWFLGEGVHSPVDIRQDEADRFDNMVDVTCKTFLGLTVACARCHDHKFDAIGTKDYYSLFGFLQSSSYRLARFDSMDHNRKVATELWQLRDKHRPALARAAAQSARPRLEKAGEYLLASREILQTPEPTTKPDKNVKPKLAQPTAESRAKVEEIAKAHGLDASALASWVTAVREAAADPNDPLHAWSKIAVDKRTQDAAQLGAFAKSITSTAQQQRTALEESLKSASMVVDYAKCAESDWIQDDVSFGPGPVRPGDLCYGKDATQPIARIYDRAAAEFDPLWTGLTATPPSANDAGSLKFARAGRTLRTPTFELKESRVLALVRGNGHAYAAVDSHFLINGPLHGKLVQKMESKTAEWYWLSMNLADYKGHRLHVEFTSESADFAVAMVLQGERAPPARPANNAVMQMLAENGGSFEALARGYQKMLTDALARLEANSIAGANDAEDIANLANWIVRHPALTQGEASDAAKTFTEAQAALVSQIKFSSRLTMAMLDGTPEDERVMIRGSAKTRGEIAPRALLEGIAGKAQPAITKGSGRLELANRILDPGNPFASRVMANRIWHLVFGRGIVGSVDNFGVQGEKPTHPELLDFLADDFRKNGWSIKKAIRSMVLTSTFQMASTISPDEKLDPNNKLLHRMPVHRLEGEAIRDSILAISGRLDRQMFGPSVPIYLNDFMQGRGRPSSGPLDGNGRRSIYLSVTRNFLSPMMLAFDTPIPFNTMGRRSQSNVPAQALILMNDPFVVQQAEVWANKILEDKSASLESRVNRMYLMAFARPANDAEIEAARKFIEKQSQEFDAKSGTSDPRVWADFAHALFNTKEFIFCN